MATKLEKSIVRESIEKVDDREIMVTLTDTQNICLKLKGMKSGSVAISIADLYKQLTGKEVEELEEEEPAPTDLKVKPTKSFVNKLTNHNLEDTKLIVETNKNKLVGVYTTSSPYYNIAFVNEKGEVDIRRTDYSFVNIEKLAKINKMHNG